MDNRLPDAQSALARYVAPAYACGEAWRFAIGLGLFVVIYLGLLMLLSFGAYQIGGQQMGADFLNAAHEAHTPRRIALLLTSFSAMGLAVFIVVRLLHRRSFQSLIGRIDRPIWRLALFSLALPLFSGAIALIGLQALYDLTLQMELQIWLLWLTLLLPLLLVQVSAEELLFRGYILQQLRVLSRWRIIWAWLPSSIFGLLHFVPEGGGLGVVLLALITLFGVIASELTARSGSLLPAIGLHLGNNIMALLVVSTTPGMTGASLFTPPLALMGDRGAVVMLLLDGLSLGGVAAILWWLLRKETRRAEAIRPQEEGREIEIPPDQG